MEWNEIESGSQLVSKVCHAIRLFQCSIAPTNRDFSAILFLSDLLMRSVPVILESQTLWI